MKIREILIITVVLAYLSIIPMCSYAKLIGHVIDSSGLISKIDFTDYSVISRGQLAGISDYSIGMSKGNVAVDKTNNHLFVVNTGLRHQKVKVYSLDTFLYIKDLDILAEHSRSYKRINVLVHPSEDYFIVRWWDHSANEGEGEQIITKYNSPDLNKVDQYVGTLTTEKIMFSLDGNLLYLISSKKNEAKVLSYSTDNIDLLNTINLESFITNGIFGREVDDFIDDTLVITENHKTSVTDINNYVIFTFNLKIKSVTPHITTYKLGSVYLFPSGSQVAFLVETFNELTDSLESTGKVLIFNAETANLVGSIQLKPSSTGIIYGVTPDKSRLIFYSSNDVPGDGKMIVINLSTFSVEAEIPIGFGLAYIYFTEVPDEAPTQ